MNSQATRDLARDELTNTNGDFTFLLKSLLNIPSSYEDGNYSILKNKLNDEEIILLKAFLNLNENVSIADLNTYGRLRLNHKLFYAEDYDKKHKRQSSVSNWSYNNYEHYGIIKKFVQYKDKSLFTGKVKLSDFYKFSQVYEKIFEANDFDKYFPVFKDFRDDEANIVICFSNALLSTCVMTHLADTNKMIVTSTIGYEHD